MNMCEHIIGIENSLYHIAETTSQVIIQYSQHSLPSQLDRGYVE